MALLELHDVSYQAGQNTILDHLSFTLEEGAFLTITGPSGSGKSTLLRVIASLVSPTNGELLFNGKQQRTILTIANKFLIASNSLLYSVILLRTI